MKKAFDQNVSRAKTRLRLGGVGDNVDASIGPEGGAEMEIAHEPGLGAELRARIEPVAITQANSEPKPAGREPSRAAGASHNRVGARAAREAPQTRLQGAREETPAQALPP